MIPTHILFNYMIFKIKFLEWCIGAAYNRDISELSIEYNTRKIIEEKVVLLPKDISDRKGWEALSLFFLTNQKNQVAGFSGQHTLANAAMWNNRVSESTKNWMDFKSINLYKYQLN